MSHSLAAFDLYYAIVAYLSLICYLRTCVYLSSLFFKGCLHLTPLPVHTPMVIIYSERDGLNKNLRYKFEFFFYKFNKVFNLTIIRMSFIFYT